MSPYPQLPTLSLPRSDRYNQLVALPDKFQQECAFSPAEFESLYGEVESVLFLCRDTLNDYGTALNLQRRRRRYKYGPRERLFIFLCFCRQYGGKSFRRQANSWNWSVSSVFVDFIWLRANLICLPAMAAKLCWGTPQERETQRLHLIRAGVCIFALAACALADSLTCACARQRVMCHALLVHAGVLPPGLDDCTFICDGTKDLGKRCRIYEQQELDYSANKGHGKSHLLFCDLFGKPLHVAAGIQGNENDRGAYLLTKIYQHPDDYLLPHHQGLFDGVFRGNLHCKTDASGVLPFNQADLRAAPTVAALNRMRRFNRSQRRLRVVVEQLFGIIKKWGLVGNSVYRGDLDAQGENFLLCTQLTAWLLESRDTYPRGPRWANDKKEDWEVQMEDWLEVDPLSPDLY